MKNCKHRYLIRHIRKIVDSVGVYVVVFHECVVCKILSIQVVTRSPNEKD